MNKFLEIPNFFNEPDIIREIGLNVNYEKCNFFNQTGIWSGFRNNIRHESIHNYIKEKIEIHTNRRIENLSTVFHINPEISCLGAPHRDSDEEKAFAGVIYLNKILPNVGDYGTTLYENSKNENNIDVSDMQIMYSVDLPLWNKHKMSVKTRIIEYKNTLTIKQKIKNEYNKMIFYYANVYHAPDYYFGDNLENSRMTIAIHGKFK